MQAISDTASSTDERPDFHVVGAGRGGTSLLAGLLDTHSRMTMGFERFSAAHLMGRKCPASGRDMFDRRVTGYLEALAPVVRDHRRRHPGLWGNKITTEHIGGLEDHNRTHPDHPVDVLERFFIHHLGARPVIFILRDGRACVASKMKRVGLDLEEACRRWCDSVRCHDFLLHRHPSSHCLRFEELVTDPEGQLRSVCSFLDLEFEPGMLAGTDNPKLIPAYRQTGVDPEKARVPEFPTEAMSIIGDDLRGLGYL